MKHILRKSALLWLCWLVAFVMAAFVKAENISLTIDLDSIDYVM